MRWRIAAILLLVLLHPGVGGAAERKAAPDPKDVEALALNMYHEARGEGRRGMLAVGWVVLNRLADGSFADRVAEIVYQNCQFAWTCDERADAPRNGAAWKTARQLASALLTKDAPPDPTRGALWFNGAAVGHDDLGARVATSTQIGNHLFYSRVARLPKPRAKPHKAVLWASR